MRRHPSRLAGARRLRGGEQRRGCAGGRRVGAGEPAAAAPDLGDPRRGRRMALPHRLRVVLRPIAAAPPLLPPMELWIEITPELPSGHRVWPRNSGESDLVVELSICRARGRTLDGAPPTALIGEFPPAWVLRVGAAQLAAWEAIGDDPPHAQLTVLTACRIWRFAVEGLHSGKRQAARWALAQMPDLPAVRAALEQRDRDPAAAIRPADVADLLRLVRARIAP